MLRSLCAQVLWHGPLPAALEHFDACGLRKLPGQEAAEFLQQLAVPSRQASLLAPTVLPVSTEELSRRFWASSTGLAMQVAE